MDSKQLSVYDIQYNTNRDGGTIVRKKSHTDQFFPKFQHNTEPFVTIERKISFLYLIK